MSEQKKSERLFCLDALRGLDMLLLTVVGPLFFALNAGYHLPQGVMYQFHHPWGGFALWDIIMPLFIFMCGAAVPFGLGKRLENGHAGWPYWRHVLVRVAMLWILGMVSQGRLLTLDPSRMVYFSNTLQSIAVGYVVAAIVFQIRDRRLRIAVPFALAAAYGLVMHFLGDYSKAGNVAMKVDMFFVRALQPCGHDTNQYTWYLTSLMFGAMTLCGMEATLLLSGAGTKARKALTLAGVGAGLLAAGWALVPAVPCIKQIFTVSFTAQAMGWSCLALAALYVVTDILMLRRGWWLVTLFGQTALLAYMCIEVFDGTFKAFAGQVTQGVGRLFGASAVPVASWMVASTLLVFVLVARRAMKRK